MVDWEQTLWRTSYKGAFFWVERDEAKTLRRVAIHIFPHRDDPYLEDMGLGPKFFDVTAYVVGDDCRESALALETACALPGPGTIVFAAIGLVQGRCLSCTRARDLDKMGYEAFRLKFIREGADTPLATVASLANMIYVAVDGLGSALSGSANGIMQLNGVTAYVVNAAVADYRGQLASLEAVRTIAGVDADASATIRNQLVMLYDSAPEWITSAGIATDAVDGLFQVTRALGDGMDAATAMRELSTLIADPVPDVAASYPTPNARSIAVNTAALTRIARIAAIAAWAEAVERREFDNRNDAITARADASETMEQELYLANGAANVDIYRGLSVLQGRTVDYLSRVVIDLAPILTVQANRSLPALWWAWRLYTDPNRDTDLVVRNRVPHPAFMPLTFEALAS